MSGSGGLSAETMKRDISSRVSRRASTPSSTCWAACRTRRPTCASGRCRSRTRSSPRSPGTCCSGKVRTHYPLPSIHCLTQHFNTSIETTLAHDRNVFIKITVRFRSAESRLRGRHHAVRGVRGLGGHLRLHPRADGRAVRLPPHATFTLVCHVGHVEFNT